jgi:nucleoside-diphosphate-sugar epimerase
MRHLITGATGFLGSALALEILTSDQSSEVVCLARPKGRDSAHDRVLKAFRSSADAYDVYVDNLAERVLVVEGDLERLPNVPSGADVAWHCAASLKYRDRDRKELEQYNVIAAGRVVEWLRGIDVDRLNHFSTAYVFGERPGECAETDDVTGYPANNVYEETKRAGERIVRGSELEWRILRPALIVGHSKTGNAKSDFGIYGFLKNLLIFKRRVGRVFGDLFSNIPMHLRTNPDAALNLIPIDRCVRAAVYAERNLSPYTTVHLSNSFSPSFGDALKDTFEIAGMAPPVYVDEPGLLSEMDRKFSDQIDFYAPYIRQEKSFLQADDTIAGMTNVAVSRDDFRQMLLTYLAAITPSRVPS